MMKRCLLSFIIFLTTTVVAFAGGYVGNEKKYFFSSDNVFESITSVITDEKQYSAAIEKYVEIMDQSTGKVSIEDLFTVCRAGGFNTYREDGYQKCREIILKMLEKAELEAEDGIMGGYCPGLDANGKNPNGLQTITDKTKIGDFCNSTNIYLGEVVFKKGYNCTCMATACNHGYFIKGGACHTEVGDANGNCLRKEYDGNSDNNSKEKCFAFCGKMGEKLGCKANTSIWNKNTNKCTCNASYDELDAVRQARIDALPYKAVCGTDKGKTGGTEYCIKDIFNWTNVGMIQATGLAAEYALVKHGKVVHCSDKYRQESNDDWVQCVTDDKKTFYEFKFDDVVESVDARIQGDLIRGIIAIHGKVAMSSESGGYYDSYAGNCDEKITKSAKKFGLESENRTNFGTSYCFVKDKRLGKNDKDKLAKIDGIDNYIFYAGIQIQGNQDLIRKLRQYVASTGKYEVKTFTCDKGVGKIMNGNIETDDILRCYLNGMPIDFVFDDNSEMWKTYQKAGKQAINCVVQGGTYSGKGCLGLSEQLCQKVAQQDKKSCPECTSAHWDANLEQCILPAGAAARNLEQGIKVGTIVVAAVAGTAVTIATGGTAGAGAALLLVEVVGATVETATTLKIQQAAVDFLNNSNRCKDASCAESMIKDNFQRLANMQNDFAAAEVDAIDKEFARLFGLVPETSALFNSSKLSDNQLSLFDADSWEPEQVWRAIGVGLQMAGLVASTVQWIADKAPRMLGRTTQIVTTKMQKALPAATNTTKALAAHTDDAAKLALTQGDDVARLALTQGDDAARLALTQGDDAARLALTQGDDAARLALTQGDDAARLALPAHVDDVKALGQSSMTRADAKSLQDIAAREAKRAAGTATEYEKTLAKADFQKRAEIYKKYESVIGSRENIEMYGRSVMRSEQIAGVETDLAKAQQDLRWAMEHSGQVSKTEMAARQAKVDRITQQLADMGVTYNKVDDVVDTGTSVVRTTAATNTATKSDDVANSLSKIDNLDNNRLALPAHVDDAANTASDAARGAANASRTVNDFDDMYQIGYKASSRDEILKKWGLPLDASDSDIAKRFKELQRRFHPDRAGPDKALADQLDEIFKDIGQERDLLNSLPKTNGANNVSDVIRTTPTTDFAATGATNTATSTTSGVSKVAINNATEGTNTVSTIEQRDGFSMFGHDLIGIFAGSRAGDRAAQ
jgi:hypothetical protein